MKTPTKKAQQYLKDLRSMKTSYLAVPIEDRPFIEELVDAGHAVINSENTQTLNVRLPIFKKPEVKQTADQAYKQTLKHVQEQLGSIRAYLARHAAAQRNDQRNWGRVGDLEAYESKLGEIIESFINSGY